MISFDLKFNGKIRAWFEENKELKFACEKIVYKDYKKSSAHRFAKKTIIAEVFLPRGGRNIYGLLGVDYNDNQSDMLKVMVNSSNINTKVIFNNALIRRIEPAYIGLPNEYSQYIVNRINLLRENNGLNIQGELNFCYAAFAEISSSGWIYTKLTNILITLLQIPKEEISSDLIMKLLD